MSLRSRSVSQWNGLKDHYIIDTFQTQLRRYLSDRFTAFFLVAFLFLLFLAAFGPELAPYEYDAIQRTDSGEINRLAGPSADHWLGTNEAGQDVLSRLLTGATPTLVTGFAGGIIIVSVGLMIGVTAGYIGGRVDSVLMRTTDFAYGIPIIPTAIVLVAYFGMGFWSSVFLIGLLLWRGNARVFRSQVLQIKEREHVRAAKMLGASRFYIITRHILPNMAGMIMLFLALGTALTILISASLAFLGFMNPFIPSWGVMIRNAYGSGFAMQAWWWTLPSGFAIAFSALIIIMLGRGYERVHNENTAQFGGQ